MRSRRLRSTLLVLVLVATSLLPAPPPARSIGIPVIDITQMGNMILAFAQRVMAYATQVMSYMEQIAELRDWYLEMKAIAAGNFAGIYGSSWRPRNLFNCSWARQYTDALSGGAGEDAAYYAGVLQSLVTDCGGDLPKPYQPIDIHRRKIENATVEALATVGASHKDLGSIDTVVNKLTKDAGATDEENTRMKALAQKTASAAAVAIAINRNIQRQQDAMIQLLAADLAATRDEQTALINREIERQSSWAQYRVLIGAK